MRARGVMEKCTYCLQRIAAARIEADRESRPVGEVQTACQTGLPDPGDHVRQSRRTRTARSRSASGSPLDFAMLEAQNTHPRTTYEAHRSAIPIRTLPRPRR